MPSASSGIKPSPAQRFALRVLAIAQVLEHRAQPYRQTYLGRLAPRKPFCGMALRQRLFANCANGPLRDGL